MGLRSEERTLDWARLVAGIGRTAASVVVVVGKASRSDFVFAGLVVKLAQCSILSSSRFHKGFDGDTPVAKESVAQVGLAFGLNP